MIKENHKTKPFNLYFALNGYPVITGNGDKVINIFVTTENSQFNVSVLTKDIGVNSSSVSHGWYSKDGEHMGSAAISESKRLFMEDVDHKIKSFKINLYKDNLGNLFAGYDKNNFIVNNGSINHALSLDGLGIKLRIKNILNANGIFTIKDIINKSKTDLENIKNFGKKTIEDIEDKLKGIRLELLNNNKLNFIKSISFQVEE